MRNDHRSSLIRELLSLFIINLDKGFKIFRSKGVWCYNNDLIVLIRAARASGVLSNENASIIIKYLCEADYDL